MLKPFRHIDAQTVAEAIELKNAHRGKARFLAGGTDLLGLLKTRAEPDYPELLINIKRIPGLDAIETDGDGARIGALTPLADIVESPLLRRDYSILADAAESVGMPQIRYMGTIGGNLAQETRCWYYRYPHEIGGRILCRRKGEGPCLAVTGDNRYHALFGGKRCFAVCPSDTAVALAALGAQIRIAGPDGGRSLDAGAFYDALGNALAPGEIVTEILIPRPPSGSRQVFLKHRVRGSIDFAVASVGVVLALKHGVCSFVRIVLGAVAPGPYRALKAEEFLRGKPIDAGTAESTAAAALEGAVPLSRNVYKIEIAKALVKRALSRDGRNGL
ncbi:FAD binding domain-containing protein [Desulfatiglans anilini]|uniref:FAD binding domain-containing protein n=1 Tax=Desulfatiglans anilini TaxID=90728 RepID=UPI00040D7302|nr:xanthine dehydrogenase family protein subunit M [Desulfatiglans anilini]